MKYFKKLVGKDIYLSPRNSEDVEKYTQWLNDFETTDYLGRSHQIMTITSEKNYLEEHENEEATFSIIETATDELFGSFALEEIDHVHQTATVGIFIGNKEARNKGFGTQALQLLLEYGFQYLNLNNIHLHVMEFNQRAIRCYQKCGFKEYGRRRKCHFLDGKYYDKIYMDILAEEWKGNYIQNKNKEGK